MNTKMLALLCWGITGILNLSGNKISKFSYGVVWFCLMLCILEDVLNHIN